MKKQILYVAGAVLCSALFALTSCKKKDNQNLDPKVNTTFVELEVEEEFTLEVANATEATFTIAEPADGSFTCVASGNKAVLTGVKVGGGSVEVVSGSYKATVMVVVMNTKEDVPAKATEAPAAGLFRLAVRVPKGTCNGVYAIGDFNNAEGEPNSWSHDKDKMTLIEGTASWYYIDIEEGAAAVKVCAVPEAGAAAWAYQWGKNPEDESVISVAFIEGYADASLDNSENGGEVKLVSITGTNILIDINQWASAPCVERNEAGKATFVVTIPANAKAEVVAVSVQGADDNGALDWNPGSSELTKQEDGSFKGEIEIGASCQYKFTYKFDGDEAWNWEGRGNADMPLDLKVNDVLDCALSE